MFVEFNGVQKKVKLEVGDASRYELNSPGVQQFMNLVDCAVLVYAIDNESTFKEISNLNAWVKSNAPADV